MDLTFLVAGDWQRLEVITVKKIDIYLLHLYIYIDEERESSGASVLIWIQWSGNLRCWPWRRELKYALNTNELRDLKSCSQRQQQAESLELDRACALEGTATKPKRWAEGSCGWRWSKQEHRVETTRLRELACTHFSRVHKRQDGAVFQTAGLQRRLSSTKAMKGQVKTIIAGDEPGPALRRPAIMQRRGPAADLGGSQANGAAQAAVTSRRCSERACSRRRPPGPAREEGTGRSRWCCGKWQEREAGTHLEAPRRRCRASCGGHPSKCRGGGRERPRRRRLPEWPAAPCPARKVRTRSRHVVGATHGAGRMEEGPRGTIGFGTRI